MAYGSSTWNSSIAKKGYAYTGYDALGFMHGSSTAEGLADQLGRYNSQAGLQWLTNAIEQVRSLQSGAAESQMQFQSASQAGSMAYNAVEAQNNREWQQYMSDTAHQREVLDLQRAGLNPILSANSGAAVGSGSAASSSSLPGSKADVDASLPLSLMSYLTSQNNNAYGLAETKMNNIASITSAKLASDAAIKSAAFHADAAKFSALTSAGATQYAADKSSAASRYGAYLSSEAQKYISDNSKSASMYGSDIQKEIATQNALLDMVLQEDKQIFDDVHADNLWDALIVAIDAFNPLMWSQLSKDQKFVEGLRKTYFDQYVNK